MEIKKCDFPLCDGEVKEEGPCEKHRIVLLLCNQREGEEIEE